MRHPRPAHLYLSFIIAIAAACGTSASGPDGSTISPECMEAANRSDLDWLEDNVFTPSCAAFSACHKGAATSAGDLNLEKGNVESSLVGQPSIDFPDKTWVVAGDPDSSYLMVILGSRTGELPEAGTMPFNNPPLCQPKRDAVERWITSLGGTDSPDAGVADAAP